MPSPGRREFESTTFQEGLRIRDFVLHFTISKLFCYTELKQLCLQLNGFLCPHLLYGFA